jgi:hypothetical protein
MAFGRLKQKYWHTHTHTHARTYEDRDSSVGIALGYGLDDRVSRVRFQAGTGNFSVHHHDQNGSGAHSASYPVGTRGSFPGGKAAGEWSRPLTSIQCRGQRMRGAIPPLPRYAFMAWCLVKHRDNFALQKSHSLFPQSKYGHSPLPPHFLSYLKPTVRGS